MSGFISKANQLFTELRQHAEARRERKLLNSKWRELRSSGLIHDRKVVEFYVAPPSFLLYVWAAFPLLMIATMEIGAIIASVIATAISYYLIHLDTHGFIRYILSGAITFLAVVLYKAGLF